MRFLMTVSALGLAAGSGSAAEHYLGFNSGSTKADYSFKFKQDWLDEFKTAQNLHGAPGVFNAVRLYTNIQAGTRSDPIQAFEAAIETKTKILLGIWASGTSTIQPEVDALKKAVDKYGENFTKLVIGISIGSEDLYRNSVTGITNKAGVGSEPSTIVKFIHDFRTAFKDSPLSQTPVGHVDTWDVWPNVTNKPVLDAVDWVGLDEYPYYETGKGNSIGNAKALFDRAYEQAKAAAGNKPVWVTETGWPLEGPMWDLGQPSVENAKTYWDEVGCNRLFNQVPTFWYNLRDSNPENKQKFAIVNNLSTTPSFNLTCPSVSEASAPPKASPAGSDTLSLPAKTGVAGANPTVTSSSNSTGSDSGSGSGSTSSGAVSSSASAHVNNDHSVGVSLSTPFASVYAAVVLGASLVAFF